MTSRKRNSGESLFERQNRLEAERNAPLAERMRPRTFEEFVGQEQVVGEDRVLFRSIAAGRIPSFILWGPPGAGKTTLARLVANATRAAFEPVSAVTSGVADLRRIVGEARERRGMNGQATILFVDEIHRFNKAQQDVILPHVENGTVTLIGATTENPSFEVIAPLLSRSRVFALQSLSPEEVEAIVQRACEDADRGLGDMAVAIADDAMAHLVNIANGDARIALNALETAAYATPPNAEGARAIDLDTISDALQRRSPMYDKAGDSHYDTISAFIKSVRGSSPDGALYWLARMIESGEDPLFIARRLVILASEDIGLADPQALTVAVAAQQAVHFIGMPEGRIPLAEATVYLATAPEEQHRLRCSQRSDVRRPQLAQRSGTPAPAQRRHRPDAPDRIWPGLQVLPRLRGPLRTPGVPASGATRPPLLPPRQRGGREGDRRPPQPLVGRRSRVSWRLIGTLETCPTW